MLHFTAKRIRFLEKRRHVVVTAEHDGIPINVLISCGVIEHLAAARHLSKDESFTALCETKSDLQKRPTAQPAGMASPTPLPLNWRI